MADTTTANLGLTKPEPLAPTGFALWAPKLNTDFDLLDALFNAAGTGTSVGLHVGTGKKMVVDGTGELNTAAGATTVLKGITLGTFFAAAFDDTTAAQVAATLGLAPIASPVFTGTVTLPADPTLALQAATKQYVDSLAINVGKRARVRTCTIANIVIATALNNADVLNGVTLATGDLVLVKNQTASQENGVYVVGTSPARTAEFDTYNEHPGSLIAVEEGTDSASGADTLWLCTSNDGGTLNTTAIAFSKMVIAGELLAANNLSDLANAATARTNLGLVIGTDVQAFDTTLANLAAADWVLNSFPIGSGANTLAQVAFAANTFPARASTGNLIAKVISDDALTFNAAANNAAMRAALGVAIGTNVQAWDADLDLLAAFTLGVNTFPMRSSAGAVAAKAMSDFALTFLDDADGPAVLATLGVAYRLLSTTTFAADATKTIALPAGYSRYEFVLSNVIPSVDSSALWVRTSTDGGTSFDSAAASYAWARDDGAETVSVSDTKVSLVSSNVSNVAAEGGVTGNIALMNPSDILTNKRVNWTLGHTHATSAGTQKTTNGTGVRLAIADIDAVQFLFDTGNLTSGTVKLYGCL